MTLSFQGVSVVALKQLALLHAAAKERKSDNRALVAAPTPGGGAVSKPAKPKAPAIDKQFFRRLCFVLRIVVPSWRSEEAFLLGTQTALLFSRSLLSMRMARLGGDGLKAVVKKDWTAFKVVLADFMITGGAASFVNSGLKFLTNSITVAFRRRLTAFVHARYLARRFFYRAAVLRLGNLDNADQRIVEDLNQWCATAADLFSRTFKPALDVVLCTQRMSRNLGLGGLAILYSYFLAGGAVVRFVSPPIPRLIAEEAALEGDFRRAHARLIAHAEEVAFLEGAERERVLLNGKLAATTSFATRLHLLQFRQGCVDQWVLKYAASCVGWPILALPFLASTNSDPAEVAARYRESDSLMQSASASLGDLLLVYKKLQRLAGFTARVTELLEAVEVQPAQPARAAPAPAVTATAAATQQQQQQLPPHPQQHAPPSLGPRASSQVMSPAQSRALFAATLEPAPASAASSPPSKPPPAASDGAAQYGGGVLRVHDKPTVLFEHVSICSPDGRLLLKSLDLEVGPGRNVVVTGPNGAGKTSMFRVMAGLWPPAAGVVTRPRSGLVGAGASASSLAALQQPGGDARCLLFYVPQRPYLVSGTLRDQVTYPLTPGPTCDGAVLDCLRRVGLAKLATGAAAPRGLATAHHDWADVLSGGEKQRVGLARLFFHKPRFAVLDESTSAINPDEEGALYRQLSELGITVFSIAHRLELRKFHQAELHFAGDGTGGWTLIELDAHGKPVVAPAPA